jgi:hypothetical protein
MRSGSGQNGEAAGSTEAAAYNLLQAPVPAGAEPAGSGSTGARVDAPAGTAWLALPAITRAAGGGRSRGARTSSTLGIVNRVPEPGYTRVALHLFDRNGPLDIRCMRIESEHVARIDLDRLGYIAPGFVGGALVSASYWDHTVVDPVSGDHRNRVDLGAVVLARESGDLPGDQAVAMEAVAPVSRRDARFSFCDGPRFLPGCKGN